jgi:hypothetical protein
MIPELPFLSLHRGIIFRSLDDGRNIEEAKRFHRSKERLPI